MAAAGGRDVGEDLTTAPGHEPGEGLGLSADRSREDSVTFMTVLDIIIMNIAASAGEVKIERQHPAGARTGVIDRDGARLVRWVAGQGPGMPGGESATAVTRDPDVRSPGKPGSEGLPRQPRVVCGFGDVREPITARRYCFRVARRVAARQC